MVKFKGYPVTVKVVKAGDWTDWNTNIIKQINMDCGTTYIDGNTKWFTTTGASLTSWGSGWYGNYVMSHKEFIRLIDKAIENEQLRSKILDVLISTEKGDLFTMPY